MATATKKATARKTTKVMPRPQAKKATKKVAATKRTPTAKKATKVDANAPHDSRHQRATDAQIRAHVKACIEKGMRSPWEIKRAAKHTPASASRRRFVPIAREMLEKAGIKQEDQRKVPAKKASTKERVSARAARLDAMKAEHAAHKAWETGGKLGPEPKTPTLDAENAKRTSATKATVKTAARKTSARTVTKTAPKSTRSKRS
jgi:hypothetical protein